jgi:hypothetical protein
VKIELWHRGVMGSLNAGYYPMHVFVEGAVTWKWGGAYEQGIQVELDYSDEEMRELFRKAKEHE